MSRYATRAADRGADVGRRPETERGIEHLAALHRRYLSGEISRGPLLAALFGPLRPRLARGPRLADDLRCRLDGWPEAPPGMVLTTYFASRPDPQTGTFVPAGELAYVAPWYRSLRACGDRGVVFHDHLDRGFMARHQTDRIRFVRVRLGDYNLNDERFMLYLHFLLDRPCGAVFMTDATDVTLTRSPFGLVNGGRACRIFVGRDRFNLLGHSAWMAAMAWSATRRTGRVPAPGLAESPMYNAGVVGGPLYPTLFLLVEVVRRFLAIASPEEHDMLVLNEVIHRHFRVPGRPRLFPRPFRDPRPREPERAVAGMPAHLDRRVIPDLDAHANAYHVVSGHPVCSAFGEHQADSDAVFIHK